jgi:predicted ArsR family transcriptional regulator
LDPSVPASLEPHSTVMRARFDVDVAAIASLAEPTRRALYLYVRAQASAVSRDEAAAGVGVPRHGAKFHLDKLVGDGLLEAEYRRRSGRQGPGAGRPAKLYRRASRELAVMLPDRRYELAGQLMALAITEARDEGLPVVEALGGAARNRGHRLGDEALRRAGTRASATALLAAARGVLDDEGYETRPDPAGLTLANCPFRALAREYTAVVCGMNLAIMEGLAGRLGKLRLTARPDPADRAQGKCCVRLAAEDSTARGSRRHGTFPEGRPHDQADAAVHRTRPEPVAGQPDPALPA